MCVEFILARVAFTAEVAVEGGAGYAGGFGECGWVGDAAGWHCVIRGWCEEIAVESLCVDRVFEGVLKVRGS